MHMSRKNINRDRQWGAIVQSLSTRLCWLTKLDKDHRLDHQPIETINHLGRPTTWYALTVGKRVIRNSVATRLLAIRSGGTSQRSLVKRLLGKL